MAQNNLSWEIVAKNPHEDRAFLRKFWGIQKTLFQFMVSFGSELGSVKTHIMG